MTLGATRSFVWLILTTFAAILSARPALAVAFPPKPAERQLIVDAAGMRTAADAQSVQQVSGVLLTEKRVPIYVVTIDRLSGYGAGDWTIERYSGALFNNWGIGFPDYNYGVLLLISKGDRKARIELGAGWKRDYDDDCLQIMDELIIPEFKQRRFSEGILNGVRALDAMARGNDIPRRSLLTKVGDQAGATWTWLLGHWQFMV